MFSLYLSYYQRQNLFEESVIPYFIADTHLILLWETLNQFRNYKWNSTQERLKLLTDVIHLEET